MKPRAKAGGLNSVLSAFHPVMVNVHNNRLPVSKHHTCNWSASLPFPAHRTTRSHLLTANTRIPRIASAFATHPHRIPHPTPHTSTPPRQRRPFVPSIDPSRDTPSVGTRSSHLTQLSSLSITPQPLLSSMNFFNRSKTRSPVESVRSLRDYLNRLDAPGSAESKKKVGQMLAHEGSRTK